MQRAANLHDWDYDTGPKEGKRLSQVDAELFKRWSLEALSCEDPMDACHRIMDVCRYWPIARRAGHLLYGRNEPR